MTSQSIRGKVSGAVLSLVGLCFAACGGSDVKYQPKAPYTGPKPNLPAVPTIPKKAVKSGDAYTAWGASYHLRSRVYRKSVAGKELKLTGYIVKTNLPDAPKCAVHETGKEDPEDCKAPIPAFWVGDSKDAPLNESVKIMGWASNYAQIYDAIKEFKKRSRSKKDDEEPLTDNFWGVKIPDPLPVKGAKVTVAGEYSTTFTKATTGVETDPIMGILTYDSVEYLEKASELATLPGM